MKRQSFAAILCLILVGQALAQLPMIGRCTSSSTDTNGCLRPGCCPDDYCRKPMPVICPLPRCGTPDDYDCKRIPCLSNVPHCGTIDDYCRKALPQLLCPSCSPYLQCGPLDTSLKSSHHR